MLIASATAISDLFSNYNKIWLCVIECGLISEVPKVLGHWSPRKTPHMYCVNVLLWYL